MIFGLELTTPNILDFVFGKCGIILAWAAVDEFTTLRRISQRWAAAAAVARLWRCTTNFPHGFHWIHTVCAAIMIFDDDNLFGCIDFAVARLAAIQIDVGRRWRWLTGAVVSASRCVWTAAGKVHVLLFGLNGEFRCAGCVQCSADGVRRVQSMQTWTVIHCYDFGGIDTRFWHRGGRCLWCGGSRFNLLCLVQSQSSRQNVTLWSRSTVIAAARYEFLAATAWALGRCAPFIRFNVTSRLFQRGEGAVQARQQNGVFVTRRIGFTRIGRIQLGFLVKHTAVDTVTARKSIKLHLIVWQ